MLQAGGGDDQLSGDVSTLNCGSLGLLANPDGLDIANGVDGFVDCACDTDAPQQRVAGIVDGIKRSRTAIRIGELNFIRCRWDGLGA
jgi:hypothetical protein